MSGGTRSMALNKTFSAADGLSFAIEPTAADEQTRPKKPVKKSKKTESKPKEKHKPAKSNKFEKTMIKKHPTRSVRKQILITEGDSKLIDAECERLDVSFNEFINLLVENYFG